jgi:hypothetical protein
MTEQELQKLKQEHTQLLLDYNTQHQTIQTLKDINDNLEQDKNELSQQLTQSKDDLQTLTLKINKLNQDYLDLQEDNNHIQNNNNQLSKELIQRQQLLITSNDKVYELQNHIIQIQNNPTNNLNISQTTTTTPTSQQSTITNNTIPNKRLNMNTSQPTFSGNKSENINDWLNIVKDNMQLAHIPPEDHVLMASSYLRLNALQFWYSIRSTDPNWDQYSTALKNQFLPKNYQQVLYDKISLLKCKADINDYIKDFNYYIFNVNDPLPV